MQHIKALPKPFHELGYSYEQLEEFFSAEEFTKFKNWITGQTGFLEPTTGNCGYYTCDVERFTNRVLKGKNTYFD